MKPLERRLIRESAGARAHLITTIVVGVLSAALVVTGAVLLARIITRAFTGGASLGQLTPLLIALALVALGRGALAWVSESSAARGAATAMSDLRLRLADRVVRDRPTGLTGTRSGDLAAAAVQGVDALEAYFARYLPQLALAAFIPLIVVVYTASVDLTIAAILLVTLPLIPVFMVLIGVTAGARARGRWVALTQLSGHYLDVVRGLRTLRAHCRADAQGETIARVGERYRVETMGTLRIAFLSALVLELFAMLGTALIAVTIGVRLVHGGLGLEAGLVMLILAPEAYGPLRALGAQFHATADGLAAAERIHQVLDLPPALHRAERPRRSLPSPASAPLTLTDVSLTYPGRTAPAVAGLDLEIAPGELVAVRGPNGAGKSTLAQLILRLLDPDTGSVRIGGVDLRDAAPETWWSMVAWVPQRPTLFAGTLAENVALADPGAPESAIDAALARAGLSALTETLDEGMHTRVGDGGRPLSSGERQRVALARAFLRDAPLLVVDEPTAGLDAETAAAIDATLEDRRPNRAVLAIAHRPGIWERADRVVAMIDGRVVDPVHIAQAAEVGA